MRKLTGSVWLTGVFIPALVGSLLLWAALPPWNLWPLGWLAPIPWLLLIRRPVLSGAHPYGMLWLAGLAFWLPAIHWLRLPHPATAVGWIVLACYLACYLPIFVGLTRVAVQQLRISVVLAAPVTWTGLELARAHLLTGFLMAALGHTQWRWIDLIQISDLGGAYAVSFVVMMGAACAARMWPAGSPRRITWWPMAVAVAVLATVLGYGHVRATGVPTRTGPTVAIIQGSIDADWKADPRKTDRIFWEYYRLSAEALDRAGGKLDLIVWPETMFPHPLLTVDRSETVAPAQATRLDRLNQFARQTVAAMVQRLRTPMLLGVARWHYAGPKIERFNSAVFADRSGRIVACYDKMHLVMFGEYVPLASHFPWLYRFTPLGGGLCPGRQPRAIECGHIRYAPNICFETVLPHTIRDQVVALARRGQGPDVLVNLTNDGWFWGSSELDMHLICDVFRAVECRRPLLVAANGGISAWIDGSGQIIQRAPRRQTAVIIAKVRLDSRQSVYLWMGDWPAGLCLLACLVWGLTGMRTACRLPPRVQPGPADG